MIPKTSVAYQNNYINILTEDNYYPPNVLIGPCYLSFGLLHLGETLQINRFRLCNVNENRDL